MITLQNILDIAEPALKLAALKGYSVDNDIFFSINHRLTRCLGRFMVKPIYVDGGGGENKNNLLLKLQVFIMMYVQNL